MFTEFDYDIRDKVDNGEDSISDAINEVFADAIRKMGDISFDNCKFTNKNNLYKENFKLLLSLFSENEGLLKWFLAYFESKMPEWKTYVESESENDYVLSYYISHYLCLLLYSIFIEPSRNENNINICPFEGADISMKPFYDLIYQFAIYNTCFPKQSNKEDENHCLKQFMKCMSFLFFIFYFHCFFVYVPVVVTRECIDAVF